MLQILKRPLEYLLGTSVNAEKTRRERKLERLNASQRRDHAESLKEHQEQIRILRQQLEDCHKQLGHMEEVVSNKERDIDKLEHEAEIYKEEIESLSALMGRMRKWVMSLRIAEEAPLENLLEHIREQQEREQTIWPPS